MPRRFAVGFTGSRKGMTDKQRQTLTDLLIDRIATELHHGDCVGADEQAGTVANELGLRVILHPPTNDKARAYCMADEERVPRPYLHRNQQIVNECQLLVAGPDGLERLRSGTWATVRYARKIGREVIILERNEK